MPVIDLSNYDKEDRIISSHEMGLELSEQRPVFTIKAGIPFLDEQLQGFQGGELIVISGVTKNGKTTFSRTLTEGFVTQNEFPLWIQYEIPARQFLASFPKVPLIYMPRRLKAADMNWIEQRILEGLQKYHARVAFIDHLHFLFSLQASRNASLDIGAVIRRLKMIAVREEVVIFLMAHTTKPKADGGEMGFESIRDSSIVSQESDVCLMIRRRPDQGDNVTEVSIEYSRRTGTMKKKFHMAFMGGYLRETTIQKEAPRNGNGNGVRRYWDD